MYQLNCIFNANLAQFFESGDRICKKSPHLFLFITKNTYFCTRNNAIRNLEHMCVIQSEFNRKTIKIIDNPNV